MANSDDHRGEEIIGWWTEWGDIDTDDVPATYAQDPDPQPEPLSGWEARELYYLQQTMRDLHEEIENAQEHTDDEDAQESLSTVLYVIDELEEFYERKRQGEW